MCNDDGTDNPANYIEASVPWTGAIPKPGDALISIATAVGPLPQDELKGLYQEAADDLFTPYVKNLIIGSIRLPDADSVDDLPQAVVSVLGALDGSKYEGDVMTWMKKDENRAAVVIQFAKGKPDFYPIRPNDIAVYEEQASEKWMASPVYTQLQDWMAAAGLDGDAAADLNGQVKGNLKTVAQPFIRASAMGFAVEEELIIIPPWSASDRQIKPAGQDCWLTMNAEKGIYMCNDDGTDNPANYIEASVPWTGAIPKPGDALISIATAVGPLPQDELKGLYQEAADDLFTPYVKNLIIGLIRLPDADSVDDLPQAVVSVLGALDGSKYEGDVMVWMKKDENRAAVVIQFAKGKPDFYPIRPNDIAVYEEQ